MAKKPDMSYMDAMKASAAMQKSKAAPDNDADDAYVKTKAPFPAKKGAKGKSKPC